MLHEAISITVDRIQTTDSYIFRSTTNIDRKIGLTLEKKS